MDIIFRSISLRIQLNIVFLAVACKMRGPAQVFPILQNAEGTEVTPLPTRIIVAARTPLACQLLSRALTGSGTQFKVVGCAQTKEELLKEVSEHRPDVAVVNSLLQDDPQGGIKALRELCTSGLSVHPIVVLDKDEPEQVVEAFAAGAEGVVCSTDPFKTLCKCIRCVEAGQIWAEQPGTPLGSESPHGSASRSCRQRPGKPAANPAAGADCAHGGGRAAEWRDFVEAPCEPSHGQEPPLSHLREAWGIEPR